MSAILAIAVVTGWSGSAWADSFDFAAGSDNTALANNVTVAGVLAEGFSGNSLSTPTILWLRNLSDDHGLGVCSEGSSTCSAGGGDVNEISNGTNPEGIRLTRPSGSQWTSLWVSSLDSNGGAGLEKGILYWSNSSTFSTANSHFSFGYGDFGTSAEGNILALAAAAGFDPTAQYLWFVNDSSNGTNNDYLLWKGEISPAPVPEPATLALLGTGLAGFRIIARRRAQRA